MKVTTKLLQLIRLRQISLSKLAFLINATPQFLGLALKGKGSFTLEQAEKLMMVFGAKTMAEVIDWEGMNVSCPI